MKNQKPSNQNFSIKLILIVIGIFLFCSTLIAQQRINNDLQIRPNDRVLNVNPNDLEAVQPQQVPNLVGKVFHPDTVARYLRGTEFILGDATQIKNNTRIGLIVEQSVRGVENINGQIPIDITYAVEEPNDQFPGRLIPGIIDRIPDILRERQKVIVPPFVGERFDYYQIAELLNENELQIGDTVSVVDDQNEGIVIRQYPVAGTEVNAGTRVIIAYGVEPRPEIVTSNSPDPEIVTVPNYIGLSIDRAIDRMSNDLLTPGELFKENSNEPQDIVIGQFPEPGMQVDPGTEITLVISDGPRREVLPVPVPQLIGRSLQEAAEILRETELFVGNIREQISEEREGTIIRQSPRAGTEVERGAVVDIIYSINENIDDISVPNVRKIQHDEAIRIIKESRLSYLVKKVNESGLPDGVVADQFPEPGRIVPVGSEVTIFVQNDKSGPPPWIYWVGGVLAAGVLGGFLGRKTGIRKKKPMAKKDISVDLKPVWDAGKQIISTDEKNVTLDRIHLKYISDSGTQTLKTS